MFRNDSRDERKRLSREKSNNDPPADGATPSIDQSIASQTSFSQHLISALPVPRTQQDSFSKQPCPSRPATNVDPFLAPLSLISKKGPLQHYRHQLLLSKPTIPREMTARPNRATRNEKNRPNVLVVGSVGGRRWQKRRPWIQHPFLRAVMIHSSRRQGRKSILEARPMWITILTMDPIGTFAERAKNSRMDACGCILGTFIGRKFSTTKLETKTCTDKTL